MPSPTETSVPAPSTKESKAPELGIPQLAREIENHLGRLESTVENFDKEINARFEKLNNTLREIDAKNSVSPQIN